MYHNNLSDYIWWCGTVTFDKSPLNLFDGMVFSQLAYANIEDFPMSDKKEMTLRELHSRLYQTGKFKNTGLGNAAEAECFFDLVCRSKRFSGVVLENWQTTFSSEEDEQFAAMAFRTQASEADGASEANEEGAPVRYLAFRGTDDSVVGWKEDFMISFSVTSAQKKALKYLHDALRYNGLYYVGGHSKGANLALYSTCLCDDEDRAQILKPI